MSPSPVSSVSLSPKKGSSVVPTPTPSQSQSQGKYVSETIGKRKPFLTISVDGNISSGKSTLVSTLVESLPKDFNYAVETIPEPLSKWTNLEGHNLLQMLYEDTTRNNFVFQHYVQLTRLTDTVTGVQGEEEEGRLGTIRVMERSIQNNRYCFSELARRQGTLHQAEFSVIAEWYKWLEEHTELPLDLIIYLQTNPQVVYDRMKTRGRSEESTVPLDYLKELHETYEDWLIHGKIEEVDSERPKKYHVMVIDANKTKTEVAEQCTQLIKGFLQKKDQETKMAKAKDNSGESSATGTTTATPVKPTPMGGDSVASPVKKLKLDDEDDGK